VDEVLAVARAARVVLPGVHDRKSGMAAAMEIATQMADAFSSTAQDLSRGRPTEIDALNGLYCATWGRAWRPGARESRVVHAGEVSRTKRPPLNRRRFFLKKRFACAIVL